MSDQRCVLKVTIVIVTLSMMTGMPTISSIPLSRQLPSWNDHTSTPITQYAQLFNEGTNAYVRIKNHIVDSTTTNDTDPDTYLQIDLYGHTLRTIQSYQTGEYICYSNSTGQIELKVTTDVTKHRGCYFNKVSNKDSYHSYRSFVNPRWYFAFHAKGAKTGKPKKGRKTKLLQKPSKFIQNTLTISKSRTNG